MYYLFGVFIVFFIGLVVLCVENVLAKFNFNRSHGFDNVVRFFGSRCYYVRRSFFIQRSKSSKIYSDCLQLSSIIRDNFSGLRFNFLASVRFLHSTIRFGRLAKAKINDHTQKIFSSNCLARSRYGFTVRSGTFTIR